MLNIQCKRGHYFDGDNLYITKSGKRRCKTCHKLRARKYQHYQGNLPFALRTHCPQGHKYISDNLENTNTGNRRCLLCRRSQSRRYRHLARDLDIEFSANDERAIRQKFNYQCFRCHTKKDLCIDHHYPLSAGYGLSLNNAVLLCRRCNSAKCDTFPECFYTLKELIELKDRFLV